MSDSFVGTVSFSNGFSNGFNVNPLDVVFIDIELKESTFKSSISVYTNPYNIFINNNNITVKIGSIIGPLDISYIDIIFNTIDGVGVSIPDWKDQCATIDNSFWDRDTTCKQNESNLYNTINTGLINQWGVPGVWYMVDYSTNNEKVFGEDNDRMVVRKFNIMYMTDDIPKDDKLWSKWGIEGMDNFHIYVSKSHFSEASKYDFNGNLSYYSYNPKPGDIMLSDHNKVFYEIIEVKDRYEMFLQRSHTWDITLRPLINKHYSMSPLLSADALYQVTSGSDILSQNDIIDTEKNDILYDVDSDPFSLL